MSTKLKIDEIGYWSEIKLAILDEYAVRPITKYSTRIDFQTVYIDGFAGAGHHQGQGKRPNR